MFEEGSFLQIDEYKQFDNITKIKQKLQKDLVLTQYPLRFINHEERYIYLHCKKANCTWQMRYKYETESQTYILKQYMLSHNHEQKAIRSYRVTAI